MLVAFTESLNFPFHLFLYYPEKQIVEENEIEHDRIENILNTTIAFIVILIYTCYETMPEKHWNTARKGIFLSQRSSCIIII